MNPDYMITGIKSHVHVFQSATQPLMIVFNTTEPRNGKNEFPVIWKLGDDLRQGTTYASSCSSHLTTRVGPTSSSQASSWMNSRPFSNVMNW